MGSGLQVSFAAADFPGFVFAPGLVTAEAIALRQICLRGSHGLHGNNYTKSLRFEASFVTMTRSLSTVGSMVVGPTASMKAESCGLDFKKLAGALQLFLPLSSNPMDKI